MTVHGSVQKAGGSRSGFLPGSAAEGDPGGVRCAGVGGARGKHLSGDDGAAAITSSLSAKMSSKMNIFDVIRCIIRDKLGFINFPTNQEYFPDKSI